MHRARPGASRNAGRRAPGRDRVRRKAEPSMTMNGRAMDVVGPPIQLGDFLEERRQVVLNGQTYLAWVVTNRRYPRSIMAKLDRAARTYNRTLDDVDLNSLPDGPDRDDAQFRVVEGYAEYITESARLLVPGITESELDLVDTDALANLLRELGYLPPLPQAEDGATPGEETPEGETPEAASTGDSSPESSAASTPAMELTSS